MIRLDNVAKVFAGASQPAVANLSLDVDRGELVVLLGPSGCGKTTTLKMINRLIEPTSGRIEVDGRDVMSVAPHELRRSIGYVIQEVGLFPHRTIAQNMATVPKLLGWDAGRIAGGGGGDPPRASRGASNGGWGGLGVGRPPPRFCSGTSRSGRLTRL